MACGLSHGQPTDSLWLLAPDGTTHRYLQKKTRDGRWQKRWFETNGCFLTYYKAGAAPCPPLSLAAGLSLPLLLDRCTGLWNAAGLRRTRR